MRNSVRRDAGVHEFSLAVDVLGIINEAVGPNKDVRTVHLTLGPLSGILPDALRFCFTELAKGEGYGPLELEICEVPARMHCRDCALDYEGTDFTQSCPRCQSLNRDILSGREFTVDWVELEED